MPHLSVIIPVYNEERNIGPNLALVEHYLETSGWDYELIIVDDGSQDRTPEIASRFAKGKPFTRLISNPHRGKAYAVKTGVMAATGDYILFADADLATPIQEVERLLEWITEHGYQVAIASREGIGARREGEPLYRHLMGRVFNSVVQILALKGVEDSQCGFKLFTREAAHRLFPMLYVYGGEGMEIKHAYTGAFDVELLFLARKLGYRIKEVPVTWSYVETERVNPLRDSFKMFRDVLRVRLADLLGKYRNQ